MNIPSYTKIAKVEGNLKGATISWDWDWNGASPAPNVCPLGPSCVVTNRAIENKPAVPPNSGNLTLTPSVVCGSEVMTLDPIVLTIGLNFVPPPEPCCIGSSRSWNVGLIQVTELNGYYDPSERVYVNHKYGEAYIPSGTTNVYTTSEDVISGHIQGDWVEFTVSHGVSMFALAFDVGESIFQPSPTIVYWWEEVDRDQYPYANIFADNTMAFMFPMNALAFGGANIDKVGQIFMITQPRWDFRIHVGLAFPGVDGVYEIIINSSG